MRRQVLLVLEGLPPAFTSEDLKRLCEPYGNVLFAKVLWGSFDLRVEQLGFVRMETLQQGEKLIDHLHGRHIEGHTIKVTLLPQLEEA